MTNDKPLIHVVMDPALIDRIDDYRFANRFPSRSDAIRWLIEWALAQNPKPSVPS